MTQRTTRPTPESLKKQGVKLKKSRKTIRGGKGAFVIQDYSTKDGWEGKGEELGQTGDIPSTNPSFRSKNTPWEQEGGEAKDKETSEEPAYKLCPWYKTQQLRKTTAHWMWGWPLKAPCETAGRALYSTAPSHYCSPCPLQ